MEEAPQDTYQRFDELLLDYSYLPDFLEFTAWDSTVLD